MISKNLNDVVKNALIYAGCQAQLIEDIDCHSTIKIDLKETACIYIGKSDESVFIWSDICEFHESVVRLLHEKYIKEIIDNFIYALHEKLMLRESEGKLQLYLEVKEEYVNEERIMADMLNLFFERQLALVNIIRQ